MVFILTYCIWITKILPMITKHFIVLSKHSHTVGIDMFHPFFSSLFLRVLNFWPCETAAAKINCSLFFKVAIDPTDFSTLASGRAIRFVRSCELSVAEGQFTYTTDHNFTNQRPLSYKVNLPTQNQEPRAYVTHKATALVTNAVISISNSNFKTQLSISFCWMQHPLDPKQSHYQLDCI